MTYLHMVFSIFTELCSHHQSQVENISIAHTHEQSLGAQDSVLNMWYGHEHPFLCRELLAWTLG